MSANYELIREFIDAWGRKDLDAIMDSFTDNAEYANIPMGPPHVGKQDIRAFIEGFIGNCEEMEFILHQQVAQGNVVMNERTDRIKMNGSWVELPVMGIFEIQDGKIAAWRDYFDLAMFSS
jgi:limonene-1,2-epoxide hydrolase